MLTIEVDNFDLGQICRSGQCVRMDQISDDRYRVIAGDKYLELTQEGGIVNFFCPEEDFIFFWILSDDPKQLCPVCLRIISLAVGRSWIKGRRLIIYHISDVPIHNVIKYLIGKIQHFPAASEVFMEIYFLFRTLLKGVTVVFFHKKFRPGQTKPIDALLYIPYHKQVVFSGASA